MKKNRARLIKLIKNLTHGSKNLSHPIVDEYVKKLREELKQLVGDEAFMKMSWTEAPDEAIIDSKRPQGIYLFIIDISSH